MKKSCAKGVGMAENIFNLTKEDGVGVVTFAVPGDAMNTWSEAAIASYRAVLEELEEEKELTGVLFISGKPENFFAGADLKMIGGMSDPESVKAAL
ncbi:MAG TPA: enoyl-CoA hydratase-related protein, partial [Syntrophales bacterium]|nr:enoyl-CoA hydratase-related protein [Syntrophales bacterium]